MWFSQSIPTMCGLHTYPRPVVNHRESNLVVTRKDHFEASYFFGFRALFLIQKPTSAITNPRRMLHQIELKRLQAARPQRKSLILPSPEETFTCYESWLNVVEECLHIRRLGHEYWAWTGSNMASAQHPSDLPGMMQLFSVCGLCRPGPTNST